MSEQPVMAKDHRPLLHRLQVAVALLVIAVVLVASCSSSTGRKVTENESRIVTIEMADGVRCYTLDGGYGIALSCIQVGR